MALITVRRRSELVEPAVLAPERYDPRRGLAGGPGLRLGELVALPRELARPGHPGPFLVLDTGDAREGLAVARGEAVPAVASHKRVVTPGDVIISRLRPYLRQVAFLDDAVLGARRGRLVASSEFYVLRPRDGRSIAFLVPFLLSAGVQGALAAAQEGGHHPRFREETLAGLPVPPSLLEARDELSALVERGIQEFRTAEARLAEASARAEAALGGSGAERRERAP